MAMVKPKIACYITGGWTECGYMTHFLEKINSSYDYRQRFPQKNKGKKGRKLFKVNGETGSELMSYVYEDVRKYKEELNQYVAILIEDDMDDRFFLDSKTGRDYELIEKRKSEIQDKIQDIIQKPDIKVFSCTLYRR